MRSKQSGVIMIFTLVVLAGVVAVLATAAAMQSLASKATSNRVDQQRAELMAQSGIQLAVSTLASQSPTATSQNDTWYTLGTNGDDRFVVDSTNSFRMQILDAGSRVDLNNATETQLQNLPLTQDQIDSLLDWTQAGAQSRPLGAKDQYYNGLGNAYNASEAPLHTIDELLLVKNFTPATLFTAQQGVNSAMGSSQVTQGTQTFTPVLYDLVTVDSQASNTTATGAAKLNPNTASRQQLINLRIPLTIVNIIAPLRGARPRFTSLGALLNARYRVTLQNAAVLINNLAVPPTPATTTPTGPTTGGTTGTTGTTRTTTPAAGNTANATTVTGKIDINTANQAVLQTIPNLPTDAIQGIISRQTGTGFTALGDLTQVAGMTLPVLSQTIDMFTISSQAFVVRIVGTSGNMSVPLEAVITLKNGTASISKITHPPFNDMIPYWHWATAATNDVSISTGS